MFGYTLCWVTFTTGQVRHWVSEIICKLCISFQRDRYFQDQSLKKSVSPILYMDFLQVKTIWIIQEQLHMFKQPSLKSLWINRLDFMLKAYSYLNVNYDALVEPDPSLLNQFKFWQLLQAQIKLLRHLGHCFWLALVTGIFNLWQILKACKNSILFHVLFK